MAANGPDRGFVQQQVVYGVTLTYDQNAKIIGRSPNTSQTDGPFSDLEIRVGDAEGWRKIEAVSTPGDKAHIKVAGTNGEFLYKIEPGNRTFKRTPGAATGPVTDLRLRRQQGNSESVIDIFQAGEPDDDKVFIITQFNPTCRYRLNQATGQWEQVC
jgi:hypothetical protein